MGGSMRRLAMAALFAGVLMTTLSLTATPAGADVGFWRTIGLSGVDAFGVYDTGSAKVTLNFDLKDLKKDDYSAAVRFTFTEPGQHNSVRVAALHGDGIQDRWQTVTSANTGHLYAQECLGTWDGGTFTIDKCGGWRRHY
jgi:hypothetical protein